MSAELTQSKEDLVGVQTLMPQFPVLTPGLWLLVGGETRSRFTESGEFLGAYEVAWRPSLPDSAALAELKQVELELAGVLDPAPRQWLTARIYSLLSHYPGKPLAQAVEMAIGFDWVEDLEGFPAWAVQEAARQWRRNKENKWRPAPGEMMDLCERIVGPFKTLSDRVGQLLRFEARSKESGPVGEQSRRSAGGFVQLGMLARAAMVVARE
ncbi:MAG TPA: hypothetical protein VKT80_18465 [Chloroflexota bacterium]|nr:hypothetical protein [Chloroflexota bacterium]